ncbi:MAG: hypothetical protein AB1490_24580 [Pseudomonadota bacterium]|jgi:hypothetical protein
MLPQEIKLGNNLGRRDPSPVFSELAMQKKYYVSLLETRLESEGCVDEPDSLPSAMI